MQSHKISVIILNYNGSKYIVNCLSSVLKSSYDNFEVILVDNASTDDSISIVEELFNDERIRIVRNSSNLGFCEGNNIGYKYTNGDYLVFLNNDTEVDPKWLDELVKVMESEQKIGIAQSKLLLLNNRQIFDSTGDFLDYYCLSMQRGLDEIDRGQYDNVEEIFSARGASLIIKRKVIKDVGLFDPDFYLGYEDIDLCWRVRLRGYKVMYVPKSIVYHKGNGTPSNVKLYHSQKNIIILMIKNYNAKNIIKYLPGCLVIIFGGFIKNFFTMKDNKNVLVTLKSFRWILKNLQNIFIKRYIIQHRVRKVTDNKVKNIMLHTNFRLYTRYMLEMIRVMNNPEGIKNLRKWYYFITKPI
ncbi:MAG: glycosyltransferase family 2 protein [Ignavibacteria bacterium]|jgi:GT2 family glycosyltransferase